MGYSCTTIAATVMKELLNILQLASPFSPSNEWEYKGKKYFEERGRENVDGAITGSVYLMIPIPSSERFNCKRIGGYRIEPNGAITCFPKTSSQQRKQAVVNGLKVFRETHAKTSL